MKSDTLTIDDENTLQALAHELEIVAEKLRARAFAGRAAGTLADVLGEVDTVRSHLGAVLRARGVELRIE